MEEDLEALRRRLYRSGADDADLHRYREAIAVAPAPEPEDPGDAGPVHLARLSRRVLLLAGAPVAAALGIGALALRPGGEATAARTSAPTSHTPLAVGAAVSDLVAPELDASGRRLLQRAIAERDTGGTAARELEALLLRDAWPATPRPVVGGSAGGASDGEMIHMALGRFSAQRGDRVLLSVVSSTPVRCTWAISGRLLTTGTRGSVLEAATRGAPARLQTMAGTFPVDLAFTSMTVAAEPPERFDYRLLLIRNSAPASGT